ncbi:MAG: hypothetical protein ACAH07_00625 [Methylophilaceae bacterium]|nr:hypothetical protein [Methyloradius sp.]
MFSGIRGYYVEALTSASHLGLLFVAAHSESQIVWIICLALIALISIFAWASNYRRSRLVSDTPLSRIASAAQGYVELSGRASVDKDNLILSPLSNTSCIWYRYWIYTKNGKDNWQQTDHGVSSSTFEINDGSGKCQIDPDNAEVIAADKKTRYENAHKYVEELLYGGGIIYALGELTTIGGANSALDLKQDVGELLANWKQNPAALKQRFDLDKNGEIDLREWELARRQAVREITLQHREIHSQAGVNVMRAPRDGRIFLLSNLSPDKLKNRYLLWGTLHLLIMIAAATAAFIMWQDHQIQTLFH